MAAALALRARILESVGAETAPAADESVAAWQTGPVTTYLAVEAGAEATPDLAVLRVVTPAGTAGDMGAALGRCGALNALGGTSRWTAGPAGPGLDGWSVRASCTFTVGPHNATALEPFILACVREQAAAVAHAVTGEARPATPVPRPEHAGQALGYALKAAFRQLVAEMLKAGTGAWLSASEQDEDGPDLTCEMPSCWDAYPDGAISHLNEARLPTALVEAAAARMAC